MELLTQYHYPAAVFIARVFLGFLFFFQGYDAVFGVKLPNVIRTFEYNFERRGIPRFLTVLASWFTSYTALVCGFLLIAGLFQSMALFLLGLNLLVASVGFGINTAMWDTRHVFVRLVLLLFLLLVPAEWNTWAFDQLLFK
jgi:uncharacterized membrane protein YphA (DoxX/SURF4 family)